MHLQSKSGEIESNPVFIPKRTQISTKSSFVVNGYQNKFKTKEISVNGSLHPKSNFKTKPIKPLNTRTVQTIPVKAEIHQQMGGHQNQFTDTNGSVLYCDENSKTIAIKGILKPKSRGDSMMNGVIKHVKSNQLDDQTIISEQILAKHKTHNQDSIIANMKNIASGTTPSTRRKSSVQFDIHNIKESTRVQLNSNTVSLLTNSFSLVLFNKFCSHFANNYLIIM